MPPSFRLSVLVPVYNEVGTVRTLLGRVLAVPIPKEVIVIDDCSTDGTRAVLEAFRAETPDTPDNRLVFLFREKNGGKGSAVASGVPHVTGDVALIQDADLEYDPAEYPRLLQPILDGKADVVYGSRFVPGPGRVLGFYHTLGNRMLTLLSNLFTNLNLTDMETCYKVFRADILKRIPIRSHRFGLEPELTAKIGHLRCRIHEVPISYEGRQYSEGKKIGWKDAVSAAWTIVRFRLTPDVGREDESYKAVRKVEALQHYAAFQWDLVRPWVGRRILEVGSRTGVLTQYLATREHLVATEPDPEYVEILRRTYGEKPNVEVRALDLAALGRDGLPAHGFDTVICARSLEHVPDDVEALRIMRGALAPGGRIVLLLPALPALFGTMDRVVGHRRRYTRPEVEQKLAGAGFEVEHVSYFNVLGAAGWFVNARLLGRGSVPGIQARLNDRLVPLLRLEQRLHPPLGLSLLAVGRAPA